MKLITDNAFSKAWKIICPTCRIDQPNSMLWFKKQCHECEIKDMADKKYTEADIRKAIELARETESVRRGALSEDWDDIEKYNEMDIINSLNKQD